MKLLEVLRARLKTIAGEIETIGQKDTLTAEELKSLTDKTAELAEVEKQVEAAIAAEQAVARNAAPANAPVGSVPAAVEQKLTAGEKIGVVCMGMVHALKRDGTRGDRATYKALEEIGFGNVAREFSAAQRSVNSANASAGGILVPETMSAELIDILRPNTTFLQGGPQVIPMPNGTYKMPAAAGGATASYRGETKPAAVVSPTFKSISMSAKLLASIVPLSNQILRWSLPNVRSWAERDLSLAMATKMDHAAYFGSGLEDTPLGLTNIPGTKSVTAYNSTTPTVAQIDTSARSLETLMFATNLPQGGAKWLMSMRTFLYLSDLRDGNGNHQYPSLHLANPTWRGRPIMVTNQISDVGGGSANESKILLVVFSHVLFGDAMSVQLAVSDTAYVVNGSDTINAFQDDMTLIRAQAEHDFDVKYLEAVGQLTAVKWGA